MKATCKLKLSLIITPIFMYNCARLELQIIKLACTDNLIQKCNNMTFILLADTNTGLLQKLINFNHNEILYLEVLYVKFLCFNLIQV